MNARIGFFCGEFPNKEPFNETTTDRSGGSGLALLDLIMNLGDNKYQLKIFSIGNKKFIQKESPINNLVLYRYPHKLTRLIDKFGLLTLDISLNFLTEPLKNELDLIHCQLSRPLNVLSALIYCSKRKVPFVLSIQGVPKVEWGSKIRQFLMKIYIKTLYSMVLEKSDVIIVLSKGVIKEYSKFKRYKHKIRIVPNGVDFVTFSKYNNSSKFTSIISDKLENFNNKLLFVGSLVERKGIYTLIDAFDELLKTHPSTCLVIVGKGPLKSYIHNKAQEKRYQENVIMTGFVSMDELVKIYTQSDLFVLPSLGEGFPLVLLESMAAGTPCLVSNISTNVSAIGEGKYGLVAEVSNPGDFADKIRQFIEMDENEKEELSKMGTNYAKSHTWREMAQHMEDIYDKLLKT